MTRKSLVIITFVVGVALCFALLVFRKFLYEYIGEESFKTALQFSLVTILGGATFLYFNILKDDEEKRQLYISTKHDLVREIDSLYRSTKHIKRTLRSRSTTKEEKISIE